MNTLGRHLLVELFDCNTDILNNTERIKDILTTAATISGATILSTTLKKFKPHGVSGVVVIAESHISIHTWPEYSYAACDIFTCGDKVWPEKGAEYLIKEFESKNSSVIEVKRGILNVTNQNLKYKLQELSVV
ncbi:MAG: adenosylmethionine decarboxylase [bacterium]|nr:adenosylmethionine decarboxylase [bacterium]